jgi:hypothetical protein
METRQILEMLAKLNAKIDANQAKAEANTKANQAEILARMREDIKSGQAEMRSILDAWLTNLKDGRKETTACQQARD